MTVFFPTPIGYSLSGRNSAELLQAFTNIKDAVGDTDGQLTKNDLINYTQIQFTGFDPNAAVADYLLETFDTLAPVDNQKDAIGVDDLVQPTFPGDGPYGTQVDPGAVTGGPQIYIQPVPVFFGDPSMMMSGGFGGFGGFGDPFMQGGGEQPMVTMMFSMMQTVMQFFSQVFVSQQQV